jgi:hypothetical protein
MKEESRSIPISACNLAIGGRFRHNASMRAGACPLRASGEKPGRVEVRVSAGFDISMNETINQGGILQVD